MNAPGAFRSVLDVTTERGVAIIRVDSPPVNALGLAVRRALQDGLAAAIADEAVAAIVISCAGRTFFAGADITEFDRPIEHPDLNALFEIIENSPKPVIAAIHGTALGGGFELALACHYRVALSSAMVGLPEVTLGLIPGAGGTQRAPRLAGVENALDLIVGSKPLRADAARTVGLIDEVIEDGDLEAGAIAIARRLVRNDVPLRRARDLQTDLDRRAARQVIDAFVAKNAQLFVGFKAPAMIVKAIEAATHLDFDAGRAFEQALFEDAMATPESAAQRHIFFAERSAGKVPGLVPGAASIPITAITVLGTNSATRPLVAELDAAGFAATSSDPATAVGAAAAIATADMVIVMAEGGVAPPATTLATVISAASAQALIAVSGTFPEADALASLVTRPERFIRLYFGGERDGPRLLEVVRDAMTSDSTAVTAMAFGRRLGRITVLSRSSAGPIADRVIAACAAAAGALVAQGLPRSAIDRALLDFGFPFTPPAVDGAGALAATVETAGAGRTAPADGELIGKLLYPAVNEAVKLLEEGVAVRASDIDVALVAGHGWPSFTGGPMFWADRVGLPGIVAALEDMIGPDAISPRLRELAGSGGHLIP